MSGGAWNRGGPYNVKQMNRIAEVLARIGGFIQVDAETT
jgi:hypothetical protein